MGRVKASLLAQTQNPYSERSTKELLADLKSESREEEKAAISAEIEKRSGLSVVIARRSSESLAKSK